MELVDSKGLAPSFENGAWILEEARCYELRGVDDAESDGVALARLSRGAFALETGHVVGRRRLKWRAGGEAGEAFLDVRPRAEKLEAEEWLRLVDELEEWLPGVTVGFGETKHGGVGRQGVTSGLYAEALLPLVQLLLRAVEHLVRDLRTRRRTFVQDEPFRRVRQAQRETLAYLARHPETAAWLGLGGVERTGKPPLIPLRQTRTDLEHAANRYMRWLLGRVGARFREASARLERHASNPDVGAWCVARARRLEEAAKELEGRVRRSALGNVDPAPPTDAAFAVVLDDPRYARVHALARRFLHPSFSLTESETPASVRPSYGVYELWCFLALYRALDATRAFDWRGYGLASLLDCAGTGSGARFVGRSSAGTLTLHFNRTFASYAEREGRECWSLSSERRPDFVVRWEPVNAQPTWLFLDAKYRVGHNLVDAFGSAHLYRDALRWNDAKAEVGGLLTPAETATTQVFFRAPYRDEFGLGAFVFKPGADPGALVEWVQRRLGLMEEAVTDGWAA